MQQLALGQGIKHLMALETTGFGIDDMEMKRRSKIDLDWMSAMPFRVHQLNGGRSAAFRLSPARGVAMTSMLRIKNAADSS